MNTKRLFIAMIVVFVALVVLELLLHGVILASIYEQTAELWRPEAEMNKYMWLLYPGYAVLAILFCYIYSKGYEGKDGIGEGLRYGLIIGLLMQVPRAIGTYATMPYPGNLVVYWLIGGLIESLILGLLVGVIYKGKPAGATAA